MDETMCDFPANNFYNDITIKKIKENHIKNIVIDAKQFIVHLTRRVNKSLHYNKNCYTILQPREIYIIEKIIMCIYTWELSNIRDGIPAMKLFKTLKDFGICYTSATNDLSKLIPVAINMKCYKKQHISRYYRLTDVGREIAKKIIEQQNAKL